jgi:hypothetical protein
MKIPRILAVLVALLAAAGAGAQEALPLEAFFGRWDGSAIGKRVEETTVGYGVRDLDVRISGTAEGFEITWVTVIRAQDAGADAQRRATTARFVRASPSTWEAEGADGPGAGRSHSWARLEGRSLNVYVLEIDGRGIYQMSRYERTISSSGVMGLRFTRIRDGTTVRRVTGSLLPAAD